MGLAVGQAAGSAAGPVYFHTCSGESARDRRESQETFTGALGFISCFIGGMLFGRLIPLPEHKARLLEAAESAGDVLALVTWVLFGAVLIDDSMAEVTSWQVVAYALLSLTVVRILPVVVALSGTRLKTNEKIFIGWFGPRGLASVVFTILVMDERDLPGGKTIVMTTALLYG